MKIETKVTPVNNLTHSCQPLTLDPLTVEHAHALYELTVGNREHLRAWLPWVDHIRVMADTLAFVNDAVTKSDAGEQAHWMMRIDEQWVGIVSIVDIADGQGTVGYWIGASHQGQGHTSRALGLLVQKAFDSLGLTRLRLDYLEGNEGSRRVAERNGFQRVETIPSDTLLDGRLVDRHVYRLERTRPG